MRWLDCRCGRCSFRRASPTPLSPGVPVQYGLYTAFVALVAYPIFGTSRQLAQGPSAAVCAVSAAVITPIVGAAALGTGKAVAYSAALALATGAVYIALGLLRMGWVSTFLSKAVMSGFVLGFSIGIIIDQSHKLLGVPPVDGSYIQELWGRRRRSRTRTSRRSRLAPALSLCCSSCGTSCRGGHAC